PWDGWPESSGSELVARDEFVAAWDGTLVDGPLVGGPLITVVLLADDVAGDSVRAPSLPVSACPHPARTAATATTPPLIAMRVCRFRTIYASCIEVRSSAPCGLPRRRTTHARGCHGQPVDARERSRRPGHVTVPGPPSSHSANARPRGARARSMRCWAAAPGASPRSCHCR